MRPVAKHNKKDKVRNELYFFQKCTFKFFVTILRFTFRYCDRNSKCLYFMKCYWNKKLQKTSCCLISHDKNCILKPVKIRNIYFSISAQVNVKPAFLGVGPPCVGQPVWPDDPSKLYKNNAGRSYEQYGNDWECLSMPMAEVIGRMAYKEPKQRGTIKYSTLGKVEGMNSFSPDVRTDVTQAPKSCKKSLADSNWIYCNCDVWCKCKCFCHELFK